MVQGSYDSLYMIICAATIWEQAIIFNAHPILLVYCMYDSLVQVVTIKGCTHGPVLTDTSKRQVKTRLDPNHHNAYILFAVILCSNRAVS